jgi:sarcosine oxidase
VAPVRDADVIVVGLGALGSAAVHHLQRRGASVLGLDAHPAGHAFGSSHGHHRLIRRSAWTPQGDAMAARAFTLWRDLEAESGHEIMTLNGEVSLLDPAVDDRLAGVDDPTLGGRRIALDLAELRARFPGFAPADGMSATYEAEAGFLRPEVGITAHLEVAAGAGATVRRPEEVVGWTADGDGVRVTTTQATHRAGQLVLTTGPWAGELLAGLGLPLEVQRIVNVYFAPTRPDVWDVARGAPNFLIGLGGAGYYGLASLDGFGVKIGRHDGGETTTARTIRREVDAAEIEHLRAVLDRFLPGASGPVAQTVTCMYTMTPDEQYILDRHPEHPQVLIGCGCSGTSYKFSGVLGEMLAELCLTGTTSLDRDHLSVTRFARA